MSYENTQEYEQEFVIMYLDIKTKASQLISKGCYGSKKKDVGNEMVKLQLNRFSKSPLRQAKSIDYLQNATEEFNSELPRKKSNWVTVCRCHPGPSRFQIQPCTTLFHATREERRICCA